MMIEPSISKLMEKFDSRYTLVIAAAKRARQIVEGDTPLTGTNAAISKPVSIAVNELYEGKVLYDRKDKNTPENQIDDFSNIAVSNDENLGAKETV